MLCFGKFSFMLSDEVTRNERTIYEAVSNRSATNICVCENVFVCWNISRKEIVYLLMWDSFSHRAWVSTANTFHTYLCDRSRHTRNTLLMFSSLFNRVHIRIIAMPFNTIALKPIRRQMQRIERCISFYTLFIRLNGLSLGLENPIWRRWWRKKKHVVQRISTS